MLETVATIQIKLRNTGKVYEIDPATMNYSDHGKPGSLLDIAMNLDIPLEHACGGYCSCTTCHVFVHEGMENTNEVEDDEFDRIQDSAHPGPKTRLGCQCVPKGNVEIEIPGA
jgi:ferredoxin, 2Fe-2S